MEEGSLFWQAMERSIHLMVLPKVGITTYQKYLLLKFKSQQTEKLPLTM
jgi:hypothetical protein